MPEGVAFTTRSASAASPGRPTRPAAPPRAAAGDRPVGRAIHHGDGGGSRLGQRVDDRAARASGADDHAPAARGIEPLVDAQRVEEAGAVGVVADELVAGRPRSTVFTAPRACAAGVSRSTAPATSLLWGMVTLRPSMPRARTAATAPHGRPGRHLEGDVDPVETERGERGVVNDRRERVPHRAADDGGHVGRPRRREHFRRRRQRRPLAWAWRRRRSKSAPVTANVCLPSWSANT